MAFHTHTHRNEYIIINQFYAVKIEIKNTGKDTHKQPIMRKFKIVKKPIAAAAAAAAAAPDPSLSFRLIDFHVYDCVPDTNTHSSASENSGADEDSGSVASAGSNSDGGGARRGGGEGKMEDIVRHMNELNTMNKFKVTLEECARYIDSS